MDVDFPSSQYDEMELDETWHLEGIVYKNIHILKTDIKGSKPLAGKTVYIYIPI